MMNRHHAPFFQPEKLPISLQAEGQLPSHL